MPRKHHGRPGVRNLLPEGVVYYLQAAAVDQTLAFVRQNSGPGSAIVFDSAYAEALAARLDGSAARAVAWARLIQVKATTLDQARQFGAAGQKETQVALAAASSLP